MVDFAAHDSSVAFKPCTVRVVARSIPLVGVNNSRSQKVASAVDIREFVQVPVESEKDVKNGFPTLNPVLIRASSHLSAHARRWKVRPKAVNGKSSVCNCFVIEVLCLLVSASTNQTPLYVEATAVTTC